MRSRIHPTRRLAITAVCLLALASWMLWYRGAAEESDQKKLPRRAATFLSRAGEEQSDAYRRLPALKRSRIEGDLELQKTAWRTAGLVASALDQYLKHYGHLPEPMSATFNVDCYSDTSSEEGTIYTLLGRDLVVNPHRKNFLGGIPEATIDSSGIKRGGLELDEEWACLYDPWGIFYAVDLDLNSDGKLKNPNYEEVNRGNTELRMRVLVWSGGPDRDKNTWEDNLTSWETPKILQGESGLR